MPKVSVYLPDDLYLRAKELGVSLSAVTQEALEARIATLTAAGWLQRQVERPSRRRRHSMTTEEIMAEVDDEFGS